MDMMEKEFGNMHNLRFLTPGTSHQRDNNWVYVLDGLPQEGEKVLCHGNKTICCELDMDEAKEHTAVYHLKNSSWKEDKNGNKYDVETYHSFDLDPADEPYNLIFVSRWKKL